MVAPALAIGLLAAGEAAAAVPAGAEHGVLDLRSWSFGRDGVASLAGGWSICWDELLTPERPDCAGGWRTAPVPGLWSDREMAASSGEGHGYATYRLRILLPPDAPPLSLRSGAPFTAFRLWIDGREVPGSGRVGRTPAEAEARTHNRIEVVEGAGDELSLQVQVSNFEFRGGGLRRPWYLGTRDGVRRRVMEETLGYGVFGAVAGVIGLIYLVQFALRPRERVRGYFGLATLAVGVRLIAANATDLPQLLLPQMSFATLIRTEYLTTSLLIFAGAGYFGAKLRDVLPLSLIRPIQVGGVATGAVALLGPLPWVLDSLRPIEVLAILAVASCFVGYAMEVRRGQPYVLPSFVAISLFTLAVVHDVVRAELGLGAPLELFPFFMLVWLVSEAWSMSRSFMHTYATIETLSKDLLASNRELRETNAAVERFVPLEFIDRLEKQSIREVQRGDHVEAEMNVMFCDIRGFTGLVEGMGAREAFDFINGYLRQMEPVIHRHGGFINQYLGDCIMALFPACGDAAVEAGIEMCDALRVLNRERGAEGSSERQIEIGIGVDAGALMLGTIGGAERLAGGVIGDAVNTAARVESLTKVYGTRFVLGEETVNSLADPSRFALRELDRVIVRGRRDPISVHEVLDALDADAREARRATLECFAEARALFNAGELTRARKGFEQCLERDPGDRAAAFYVDRCVRLADSSESGLWRPELDVSGD